MSLFVKIMHSATEYPGSQDEAPCSIYGDVVSVHFPQPNESQTACLWVREPIKTALVPGFCENEKRVDLIGPVYVMNEHGKTISVFRPTQPVAGAFGSGGLAAVRDDVGLGARR